jgi:hypothetical protein
MKMQSLDKKALKILCDTYWGANGWKDFRVTPADDFAYARAAGLMFEQSSRSHDENVCYAKRIVDEITSEAVADAFVVSLGSRRLDYRSALGSFAFLRHFPVHKGVANDLQCKTCGEYLRTSNEDLNVLNFERFKWGGVRHDKLRYALFDLEQFLSITPPYPSDEDVSILRSLFAAIEASPEKTTADTLEKYLAPVLKSNKSERQTLIAILGLTGILGTSQHPGYLRSFIPYSDREIPSRRFVDMTYPVCWWRRSDGINSEAVDFWFGKYLNP